MALKYFENGLGGTGTPLIAIAPFITSGNVWYLDFTNGVDAASPAGKQRNKPLKTTAQALTNCASGDTFVYLNDETFTTGFSISSLDLTFVGEGTGATRKKLTRTTDEVQWSLVGSRVSFVNLWLPKSTTQTSNVRINVDATSDGFRMEGCLVECGAHDEATAVNIATAADRCRFEDTVFTSVAIATGDQPESAIKTAGALTGLELIRVTVDGGTYGWSNEFALKLSAGAITGLDVEALSLLNDSDMDLHASTTARITLGTCSGSARIV